MKDKTQMVRHLVIAVVFAALGWFYPSTAYGTSFVAGAFFGWFIQALLSSESEAVKELDGRLEDPPPTPEGD